MSCLSPVFQLSSLPGTLGLLHRDGLLVSAGSMGGCRGLDGNHTGWESLGVQQGGDPPSVSCPLTVLGSVTAVTGQWGHPNLRVANISRRETQRAGLLVLVKGEKGEGSCRARHSRGPLRRAHPPPSEDQPPLPHHGWCLPRGEVPHADNGGSLCQN